MQADAGVVDDAVDVVVHPLPHLRRDDRRDRPGHEHHCAHRAAALKTRVDDEGDDHPEHELERDRDQSELDRLPDGGTKNRVVPERAVVLEPDPLRRLDPLQELLVREAVVDRLAERIDRDERDDRERRNQQHPADAGLPALELAPTTAATRRSCWGGDGAHR